MTVALPDNCYSWKLIYYTMTSSNAKILSDLDYHYNLMKPLKEIQKGSSQQSDQITNMNTRQSASYRFENIMGQDPRRLKYYTTIGMLYTILFRIECRFWKWLDYIYLFIGFVSISLCVHMVKICFNASQFPWYLS